MKHQLRVIYGDTDQMGVVYYANHFRFFEAARNEFFRHTGGRYSELEAAGILLPVIDAGCQYLRPLRYDDWLTIDVTLVSLKRVSFRLAYSITANGNAEVLATGHTVHASINREGRPTALPEQFRQLLAPHLEGTAS